MFCKPVDQSHVTVRMTCCVNTIFFCLRALNLLMWKMYKLYWPYNVKSNISISTLCDLWSCMVILSVVGVHYCLPLSWFPKIFDLNLSGLYLFTQYLLKCCSSCCAENKQVLTKTQSHVIVTYILLTLYSPSLPQIDKFDFAFSCITWSQFRLPHRLPTYYSVYVD